MIDRDDRMGAPLKQAIYAAAMDPAQWDGLLATLRQTFGGSDAALLAWEAHTGCPRLHATRSEPAAEYMRFWDDRNVLKEPGRRLEPGAVAADHELLDRDTLTASAYHGDFLAPNEMSHLLVLKLCRSEHGDTVVNVTRDRRAGPFLAGDLRLARRLMPDFRAAIALATRLQWSPVGHSDAITALLPTAVILLDRAGRPLYLNPAAERIVSTGDGLLATRDGLRAAHRESAAQLAQAIGAAIDGVAGAVSLPRPGRSSLAVMVTPVAARFDWLQRQSPAVVVSVVDPDAVDTQAVEHLRALYGLTRSEARLAAGLARGAALPDVAASMGLTPLSARQYLSRVYAKTGTKRQTDLVRLITLLGTARSSPSPSGRGSG